MIPIARPPGWLVARRTWIHTPSDWSRFRYDCRRLQHVDIGTSKNLDSLTPVCQSDVAVQCKVAFVAVWPTYNFRVLGEECSWQAFSPRPFYVMRFLGIPFRDLWFIKLLARLLAESCPVDKRKTLCALNEKSLLMSLRSTLNVRPLWVLFLFSRKWNSTHTKW